MYEGLAEMVAPEVVTISDIAAALKLTRRGARRLADAGNWPCKPINARGDKVFCLCDLPPEVQSAMQRRGGELALARVLVESRDAALPLGDTRSIGDRRLGKKLAATREASKCSTRECVESVAARHGISVATLYRWIHRADDGGMAGLCHKNLLLEKRWCSFDKPALDYMAGLYLRRENRHLDFTEIYAETIKECVRQGWRHGSYSTALRYIKSLPAPLTAYRDGDSRGLDNALPPIFRDYSDLDPFQIIVGDQHKFDCWVIDDDDDTEIFRPEGYLWQDLRTRTLYGISAGKRYDSQMMGHALWVGLRIYGAFGTVYTDNGAPELSKYFFDRKTDIERMGMAHAETESVVLPGILDDDGAGERPTGGILADLCAGRRLAIVKNAKAKLIERTFSALEGILRSHFRLPGSVAQLGGDIDKVDVDQAEIQRLARAGKLLRFSEFCRVLIEACDYYNQEREHRGLKEQTLRAGRRSSRVTPISELLYCVQAGWRPRYFEDAVLDIIFLSRKVRVVDRGRIRLNNRVYESGLLAGLAPGARVECRYDPMDADRPVVVMKDGAYFCDAAPVLYGSMVNNDLTAAKIADKRRLAKAFVGKWRAFTSGVTDLRQYSAICKSPSLDATRPLECQAASRTTLRKVTRIAEDRRGKVMAASELASECAKREALPAADSPPVLPVIRSDAAVPHQVAAAPSGEARPECIRPVYFRSDYTRYVWCQNAILAGDRLPGEDVAFMADYEAKAEPGSLEVFIERRRLAGVY